MGFDIPRRTRFLAFLVLSLPYLVGTVVGQDTSNESSIFAFTDEDCKVRPRPRQPGTPDGACHIIATPNATSLTVARLAHGCTITAYTDENCSFNPTAIRENQCISIGSLFGSFSVDNCTPNPPTSLSTRIRTISSSSSSRGSPTSATSTGTRTTDNADNATNSPTNIDNNPPISTSTAPPPPSSGLSSGAKAGIAVGVTLGVLSAIAVIAYFFFFKRRRPATPPVAPDHSAPPPDMDKKRAFWLFGGRRKMSHNFPSPPAELGGSYPEEDAAVRGQRPGQQVYELSATHYRELPTGRGDAEETK